MFRSWFTVDGFINQSRAGDNVNINVSVIFEFSKALKKKDRNGWIDDGWFARFFNDEDDKKGRFILSATIVLTHTETYYANKIVTNTRWKGLINESPSDIYSIWDILTTFPNHQ